MARILLLLFFTFVYCHQATKEQDQFPDANNTDIDPLLNPTNELPDSSGQSIDPFMNSTEVQSSEESNQEDDQDEVPSDSSSQSSNSTGIQDMAEQGEKRMRASDYIVAHTLRRIPSRPTFSSSHFGVNQFGTGVPSSNVYRPSSSFSSSGISQPSMIGTGSISQVSGVGSGRCGQPYFEPTVSVFRTRSQQRIVGGAAANPHSFPWMASLQQGSAHYCGGALIRVSPNIEQSDIVITASHCLAERPYNLNVLLGAHSLRDSNAVKIRAAEYHVHELYNDKKTTNDIGIIKLQQPVTFNQNIQPLCLPEQDEPIRANDIGVVAGWGTMREGRIDLPGYLMQVGVPVVNDAVCIRDYRTEVDMRYMFCAGYDNGGHDSCQGDSGGPLFFRTATGWTLRGVVSFGEGCARARKPGVYTRVSHYRTWINSKIRQLTSLPM